jgi:hypothetical protein
MQKVENSCPASETQTSRHLGKFATGDPRLWIPYDNPALACTLHPLSTSTQCALNKAFNRFVILLPDNNDVEPHTDTLLRGQPLHVRSSLAFLAEEDLALRVRAYPLLHFSLSYVSSVFREIEPDLTRFGGQLLTSMSACVYYR